MRRNVSFSGISIEFEYTFVYQNIAIFLPTEKKEAKFSLR